MNLANMAARAEHCWNGAQIVGFYQFEPHLAMVLVAANTPEGGYIISHYNGRDNSFYSSEYGIPADKATHRFQAAIQRKAGYFMATIERARQDA